MNGDAKLPVWWQWIRRVVVFALGVALIVDSLFQRPNVIVRLLVGLVMVGVLPLDDLLRLVARHRHREDDDGER